MNFSSVCVVAAIATTVGHVVAGWPLWIPVGCLCLAHLPIVVVTKK